MPAGLHLFTEITELGKRHVCLAKALAVSGCPGRACCWPCGVAPQRVLLALGAAARFSETLTGWLAPSTQAPAFEILFP